MQKNFHAALAQASPRFWLAVLIGIAIIIRVVIFFIYSPEDFPDSQGYYQMAHVLSSGDWMNNLGARPPIYPLFILALGLEKPLIFIVQSFLGIFLSLILFQSSYQFTQSALAAFVMGLIPALYMPQLFLEFAVMSEALSTFIVVSILITSGLLMGKSSDGWKGDLATGILSGIGTLTRPFFLYIAPVITVFGVLFTPGENWKKKSAKAALILIPFALMALGWSYFNLKTADVFGITSLTGYNLINHTGGFIEYAPDEYATIRDIYLEQRAIRIAETGFQTMTIWRAYPYIDPSGAHYTQISQELTKLSIYLIFRRPDLYLYSVWQAWLGFWKVGIYWQPDHFISANVTNLMKTLWTLQRALLIAVNGLFLVLFAVAVFRRIRRLTLVPGEAQWLQISALIIAGSVFQALVDIGENARYAIPFQIIIVWCVFMATWKYAPILWNAFRKPTKHARVNRV